MIPFFYTGRLLRLIAWRPWADARGLSAPGQGTNHTSSGLVVRVVRVVTLCRVTTVTCVLSTCWPERPERLSIADLCVDLVFFYRC